MLGSQLMAISTVWALIARMVCTVNRPMPDIVRSMKAMTAMIFERMENVDMKKIQKYKTSAVAHCNQLRSDGTRRGRTAFVVKIRLMFQANVKGNPRKTTEPPPI